jgi:hypothetical protein
VQSEQPDHGHSYAEREAGQANPKLASWLSRLRLHGSFLNYPKDRRVPGREYADEHDNPRHKPGKCQVPAPIERSPGIVMHPPGVIRSRKETI